MNEDESELNDEEKFEQIFKDYFPDIADLDKRLYEESKIASEETDSRMTHEEFEWAYNNCQFIEGMSHQESDNWKDFFSAHTDKKDASENRVKLRDTSILKDVKKLINIDSSREYEKKEAMAVYAYVKINKLLIRQPKYGFVTLNDSIKKIAWKEDARFTESQKILCHELFDREFKESYRFQTSERAEKFYNKNKDLIHNFLEGAYYLILSDGFQNDEIGIELRKVASKCVEDAGFKKDFAPFLFEQYDKLKENYPMMSKSDN